jgi:hypothetical protein
MRISSLAETPERLSNPGKCQTSREKDFAAARGGATRLSLSPLFDLIAT